MKNKDGISNAMYDVKKRPLNGKKTIAALVLAFAFLGYCVILLIKLLTNPTNTIIVENGKIYKEEAVDGYIIRDEQLIDTQNVSGKIVQLITEGQRAAKGEAVYRYSLENEDDITEKIAELDVQIQNALKQETVIFSTDIKLLETQIQDQMEEAFQNTNIQKIDQYNNSINNLITKKSKIAGELLPKESYIKDLINQRSKLENQLNSGSKYIYAQTSGVVSYRVDNLESKLVVGDFSYLNKEFLESMNLKKSQIIATSSTSAKIVDNFSCYIACVSETEEALNAKVGDRVKLRLHNSEEVTAEIVHKNNESDKEVLLVFKIEQAVEELIEYRKIAFDIIWWSDSGIKVPNAAIQYEGEFAYVIRNRAGYEEKIIVKVLRQNDNYAIVENYSSQELEEAGYDISALTSKKSISIYDEIKVKY